MWSSASLTLKLDLAGVKQLLADLKAQGQRIDDYCWDLYARVSQWYDASDPEKQERKKIRLETLHAIEAGGNETAEIADLLSTAVFGGISRRCCVWASNMIFCPAKVRSSI